jgi:rfaE bifunctional protein kinase chain/domain
VDYKDLFDKFNGLRILVIGDVMMDAYVIGKVTRISPEAPVPIISLENEEERIGGAGNVALNLVALGAKPIIASAVGADANGEKLSKLLKSNDISIDGIIFSEQRKTTVKTRVISNNQQLLRIDSEDTFPISQLEEELLITQIENLIELGLDAIIFEDYNKGVLTEELISRVIELAQKKNIPTAVDPKKENFFAYRNVTLFKPNLKELKEGMNINFNISTNKTDFEEAVISLESKINNEISFITLSEHGVFIKNSTNKHYAKAHLRTIADVSGAGDTVIAVATLCLASNLDIAQIAEISNIAGGLVCEKSGVVSIDKKELLQEVEQLLG